jgi:hypothetical protein
MALNTEQQRAVEAFADFLDDPDQTMFALLGGAGCGKSYTAGHLFAMMDSRRDVFGEMFWLAPTWKAVRVSGRFLAENGADFEVGYDAYLHDLGRMILTTTQQALGIRPVIADEQTADEQAFGQVGPGLVSKLKPDFIVIDEISMLSMQNLKQIYGQAQGVDAKVLVIGDPGQLPPVKAQEIKWDRIPNKFELTQVMRQEGDSMIPVLAGAVRRGEDWSGVKGKGLLRVGNAAGAFVEAVGVPGGNEEDRDVFIAYRNRVVDAVQEAACRKVYGHGKDEFAEGEFVIAQSALKSGKSTAIANQDELEVIQIGGAGEWGLEVKVQSPSGHQMWVEYLSGSDMADKAHPYRVALDARRAEAQRLQSAWKSDRMNHDLNMRRKEAWKQFFKLKDETVLNFAHPFAITSHKSQGSSYRRAFVGVRDIEQFSPRGLYVAVTRPKVELVY